MSDRLVLAGAEAGCCQLDLDNDNKQEFCRAADAFACSCENVLNILGPGGVLEKNLPGFTAREQQTDMSIKVAQALNQGEILVQEAATGTGKSLAYLVPSLLWALREQRRVVVSTRTINLQEQLWHQDVPILLQTLGIKLKVALAKGKNNYVCLWRLNSYLTGPGTAPGETAFLTRVLNWVKGGGVSGDRSELQLSREDMDYWQQICADSDLCQNFSCRWHNRECFVGRARRAAEAASLIITNHSLLFSDIKSGGRVLPHYDHLVLDEAHHLEDTATEQLGKKVSASDMRRWLKVAGRLVMRLWSVIPPDQQQVWQDLLIQAKEIRDSLPAALEMFFGGVYHGLSGLGQGPDEGSRTVRLTRDIMLGGPDSWPIGQYHDFTVKMDGFCGILGEMQQRTYAWAEMEQAWEETNREISILLEQGAAYNKDLKFIFNMEDQNFVYWAEFYGWDLGNVRLLAAPVYIGETLFNHLFTKKTAMVLTSATLSVNNDLKYFKERVGISLVEEGRVVDGCSGSPFSYDSQCRLCIATDLPYPTDDYSLYIHKISKTLAKLAVALNGKTMVLFTSHKTLRDVYITLKLPLESQGLTLLGHNIDGGRSGLIKKFRTAGSALLMGADSFWEGVDLPGDILQCVVIVKLPFWPPSVPIVQARLENLDKLGVNSFYKYSLPQAVLKFKQGFGRLIRTLDDRGAVLVLDKRLLQKNYGKYFLNSLPVKKYSQGDAVQMAQEVCRFIQEKSVF